MNSPQKSRIRYRFGPFVFDSAEQQLRREDKVLTLTPKAVDVLFHLLERPGQLVSKNDLLDAVWADTAVGDGVLKVAIAYIRKALGDHANKPRYIETAYRRGYRFIAEVERDEASGRASAPRRRRSIAAGAHWMPEGPLVSELVARDRELGLLLKAFEQACSGSRRTVFVEGSAGIGKTSLVEAFTSQLPDAVHIARGHCLPHYSTGEPYFPVLSALGKLAGANSDDEIDEKVVELLRKHAPTWLAQMPALLDRVDRKAVLLQVAGANQQRMIREMAETLEAYTADKPLLILLEDLHWADRPTLDLLSAIARRSGPARLMILSTFRPRDAGAPTPAIVELARELTRFPSAPLLQLSTFDVEGVREYLGRRFGGLSLPAEVIGLTQERTGGNPLFLSNVADDWFSQRWIEPSEEGWVVRVDVERLSRIVPENLRQMIEKQISAHAGPEQQLLETAAIAGTRFNAELVGTVLEESADFVETVCERLAGRGLFLRTDGVSELPDGRISGRYQFIHSLYRDVCRDRVAAPDRIRLHRRIAAWLEDTYGGSRPELAAMTADHFEEGRQYDKAIGHLQRAARETVRRLGYREGVELLDHGLELAEKLGRAERHQVEFALIEERATLRIKSGDFLTAFAELEASIEKASARGAARAEASALVVLGSMLVVLDFERALGLLERASELAEEAGDSLLAADARGRLAYFRFCRDLQHGEETLAALREGLESPEGERARGRVAQRMACVPMVLSTMSRHDEARRAFEQACDSLLEHGETTEYLIAVLNAVEGFTTSGHLREADELTREAVTTSERNGDPMTIGAVRAYRGYLDLLVGDFDAVLRMEADVRASAPVETIVPLGIALSVLAGQAHLGLGHFEEALSRFEEVKAGPRGEPSAWCAPVVILLRHLGLAEARLGLGQLDEARSEAKRAIDLGRGVGHRYADALGLLLLARVERAEGKTEAAIEALDAAEHLSSDGAIPLAEFKILAERASLELELGRREEAELSLQASRSVITAIAGELAEQEAQRSAFLAWDQVVWVMKADAIGCGAA